MSEQKFELPVEYKSQELMLKASLQVIGYTHKFMVEVEGHSIIFEPEEERNYRGIVPYDQVGKQKHIDLYLLKAISEAIKNLA
jgi:hypothetical protein